MFGKGKVKDIKRERLTKKVTIGDADTLVTIDRVFSGIVDGKKEILDEIMIDNMIDGIAGAVAANRTKYNPIPAEIIIKTNVKDSETGELNMGEGAIEEPNAQNDIIESYDPRFTLDQVILNASVKEDQYSHIRDKTQDIFK